MEKEVVGPGKYVTFSYRLTDKDSGKLLFEAKKEAPDVMVYGASQDVVPGLIAAMTGLGAGDRFQTELPPSAAFGPRYEENVLTLPKEIFVGEDGEMPEAVKVGEMVPMMTEDGHRVMGIVLEIGDKDVKMDFNHPYAGMTVVFDGEVESVRDATPEEMKPSHACGCGCGHDKGDCGDSCDCGSGCGGCH